MFSSCWLSSSCFLHRLLIITYRIFTPMLRSLWRIKVSLAAVAKNNQLVDNLMKGWVRVSISISVFLEDHADSRFSKFQFSSIPSFLAMLISGLDCLLAFSIYTNGSLLMSVRPAPESHIRSLDCIRFFSLTWVLSCHVLTQFIFSVKNFLSHLYNPHWIFM